MLKNIKHIKLLFITSVLMLTFVSINAQEVRIIDNKGTIQKVNKNTAGDIKYGIQTSNHFGWYLLDGSSIASLPINAQANAASLGLIGNLPDATDRVLKQSNGAQAVGSTGGQATTTLSQVNLPNVNFTGTTSTDGDHNHSGSGSSTQTLHQPWHQGTAYNVVISTGSSSSSAGDHNHTVTVNSGGVNQPIQRYQPYLVVNTFIYLGL